MTNFRIPKQPADLFKMPFAIDGAKTIIPDTTSSGRASLPGGFPSETQRPLRSGGVAPNRLDFQGILYMLSAFSFWQQSGGMFSYTTSLNYALPSLVYHNDDMWWCVNENGPATAAGTQEPGTAPSYWIEFFKKIAKASGGGGFTPVGGILMSGGVNAPEGYLLCNGAEFDQAEFPVLFDILGNNRTPDMRGRIPRGYDPANIVDPQRDRVLLSHQSDAGRNATGWVDGCAEEGGTYGGVCRFTRLTRGSWGGNNYVDWGFDIDLSRAWGAEHTSTEFRMSNTSVNFIIKHD